MVKYVLLYFLALGCFAYGFIAAYLEIPPYHWLLTVKSEIAFVKNDWLGGVERFLVPYDNYRASDYQPVQWQDIPEKVAPITRGKLTPPGYMLLFGTFDFDPPAHAAILLDSSNHVRHIWRVNEDAVKNGAARDDANKFPHGIDILHDGSIVFAYDAGDSLQRFSWCSQPMWTTIGKYSHTVALTADEKHLWSLLDGSENKGDTTDKASWRYLAELDAETGKVVRKISLRQIMDANPGIDILGINQDDYEDHYEWRPDAFHENDIEPLKPSMAAAFPEFSAGDLLISMRALDLVMVLDPDSLKVKWWRMAQTRRQHDADWQPDGTITVYDNNMHRGPLRILQIDPKTYTTKVLYNGRRDEAVNWFRGKHQVLPNGSILVTIPQQGRVLEVTPDQHVEFELINRYQPIPGKDLLVSEARWLPPDFFNFEEFPSCTK